MKLIILLLLYITLSAQTIIVSKRPVVTSTSNSSDIYVKDASITDSIGVTMSNRISSIASVTFTSNLTLSGTIDSSLAPGDTSWIKYTVTTSATGNFTDTDSISIVTTSNAVVSNVDFSVIDDVTLTTPTILVVSDSADGISIGWEDNPAEENVYGYKIYRSTDGITFDSLATSLSSTYDDTEIIEALKYYYKVSAYDGYGESSLTDSVFAKSLVTTGNYASVVYFDSSWAGTNSGTYTEPYDSMYQYNFGSMEDSSLVFFKGGYEYLSNIDMSSVTGTINGRVILSSYGSEDRYLLRNSSRTSTTKVIDIQSSSYITIQNAEIEGIRWGTGVNSQYAILDNVYCHYYLDNDTYITPDGLAPFTFNYSTSPLYLTIKNSIFTGAYLTGDTGNNLDLLSFVRCDNILIENNYFRNVSHLLLGLNETDYITIRGNRFYNKYHGALNIQKGSSYFLVEHNYFEQSGIGARDGGGATDDNRAGVYVKGDNAVFRNNIINNAGAPDSETFLAALGMSSNISSIPNEVFDNRVYNNNIYGNYGVALNIGVGNVAYALCYGNTVFNNAFSLNGDPVYGADSVHIRMIDWSTSINSSNNLLEYNYLGSETENVMYGHTTFYSENAYSSTDFSFSDNEAGTYNVFDSPTDSIPATFWGTNETIDFLDDLAVDYNPSTALRDKGRHLAQVTASSGTSLTVDDGKVFFSGHSWLDGDSIVVNSSGVLTFGRIASISGDVLTLDESMSATVGDYVDVVTSRGYYQNGLVDIGAFEYEVIEEAPPVILATNVDATSLTEATFKVEFNSNNASTGIVFQKSLDISGVDDSPELIPLPSPVAGSSSSSTVGYDITTSVGEVTYYKWTITNSEGSDVSTTQGYTHSYEEPSATWGVNLLAAYNYGFEDADVSDWTDYGATSFAVSTTQADSGTYSGKVVATFNNGAYSALAATTTGDTLQISGSLYIETTGGVITVYDFHNRSGEYDTDYSTTGEWIEFSIETVATGNTDVVAFRTRSIAPWVSPVTFYIDNVRVKIKSP